MTEGNWFTNLFSHSEAKDAHSKVYGSGGGHEASLTHEVIAAAAGFEAMRAYENHVAKNLGGQPPSHSVMKDLLAGFATAAVTRLFETKGLDWIDSEQTKHRAIKNAQHIAKEQYGSA